MKWYQKLPYKAVKLIMSNSIPIHFHREMKCVFLINQIFGKKEKQWNILSRVIFHFLGNLRSFRIHRAGRNYFRNISYTGVFNTESCEPRIILLHSERTLLLVPETCTKFDMRWTCQKIRWINTNGNPKPWLKHRQFS